MKKRNFIISVTFLILVGSARAILPPDAKAREPQLRAYYRKVRDNYETRLEKRQAESVRAYERTRTAVFTPPWMRGTVQSGNGKTAGETEVSSGNVNQNKRNHRLLVSIMLLICIGAAAGWVRFATKTSDE